ncbi:MAG: hypothetical protein RJB13_2364, partial [Pseudomonadota bacterium]
MDTSGNRTALGVSSDVAQLVGERLRRAREMIGRSTSALSAKIKVREHYLVAIENGQWDELPPGLNGRGLVRIYARELSVSVPELDQAANQAVMPAEQDAQAPYQVGHTREARPEREFGAQRVQQASAPSASRNVEAAAVRTHALSGGTTKQKASPEIHSLSRTQKSNSGSQSSARLGLTPEEQPIDVTTPDVASILGISLDMFDDVSEAKPPTQAIVEESGIEKRMTPTSRGRHSEEEVLPIIGPESAITSAGLLPSDSTSKPVAPMLNDRSVEQSTRRKGAKKHIREREGFDKQEEISSEVVHLSAVEAISSEPVVNSSAVEAISSEPVVTSSAVEAVSSEPEVTSSAVEAISSDAAEPIVLNEPETKEQVSAVANESGISAAEAYLKSHAQTSDQLTESAGHADVVGSAKMKWALGILAACVGVLIF